MDNNRFNKKIFALLLERAKGERSWRQFAMDCDISYVQMRKLSMCTQNNPPRPKLIKKLANNSFNEIDLEDYLFAAGMNIPDPPSRNSIPKDHPTSFDIYKALPAKEKKVADEFLDFLYTKCTDGIKTQEKKR